MQATNSDRRAGGDDRFVKDAWALRYGAAMRPLFEKLDADALVNQMMAGFDEFLRVTKAEIVDIDLAPVSEFVEWYFEGTAPFGSAGKKAEFPDAIIISALKAWTEESGESVYVASRDATFRDACGTEVELYALDDVTQFLNLVSRHEDVVAARILRAFATKQADAIELVRSEVKDLGLLLADYDGDADVSSIEAVEIGEPDIISVGDSQATLEAECAISFTADVSYEDHDTGIYDSEDGRIYFMETINTTVQLTKWVTAQFALSFESPADLADPDQVDMHIDSFNRGEPITVTLTERVD